jgi:hypothetical protein
MTDAEAVAIVESLRHGTESPSIRAVCDWVLALAERQAVQTARRAARNAYMSKLKKRLRRERAAQKG